MSAGTFEVTFEATSEVTSEVTFEVTSEVTFEVTFEVTSEVTSEVTFEVTTNTQILGEARMHRLSHILLLLTVASSLLPSQPPIASAHADLQAQAASLPAGFAESLVADGLNSPTAMAIAPDGRVFITQQGGQVRVVKNGQLLPQPFISLDVASVDEQGLTGIAFDPAFSQNGVVYLSYTANVQPRRNLVVRVTANGDVARGSPTTVFTLDPNRIEYHLGGALQFGADGKLYVAVGEGAGNDPQALTDFSGKILRLNADGSIPTDNPFVSQTSGSYRAIWARGLRNPYTLAVQPGTGRLYINDVGGSQFEEVNEGVVGGNYGFPLVEGPTTDPQYRSPAYAYGHDQGCAIVGGTFYDSPGSNWPAAYRGRYYLIDYCAGWIRSLDPAAPGTAQPFGSVSGVGPVELRVGPEGSLYYLARGNTNLSGGSGSGFDTGRLYRITYTGSNLPAISVQPRSQTVSAGSRATFSVTASGQGPFTYRWQRNGSDIAGANGASYTTPAATTGDNGARYRVIVTNATGSTPSAEATLTVSGNLPPAATISLPTDDARYRAGQIIRYAGSATDPERGTLGPNAFTWKVDFHHDDHVHPFLGATSGRRCGEFTVPAIGHEADTNVWYRIYLTVSDGTFSHTVFRDVRPITATLTVTSQPVGLQVLVNGTPRTAPHRAASVVGVQHTLGVTSPQTLNGVTYDFVGWSDGGAQQHTIAMPPSTTLYTANFRARGSSGNTVTVVDWAGDYVGDDTALQRYVTRETGQNLNGGNNDTRGYVAYSESQPINPNPTGGNAYGSTYNPLTSWRFYGGVLIHRYDGDFGSLWGEIWQRPSGLDRIYQSADAVSDGWMFLFWKKEDFLNGGASGSVTSNAASRFELLGYAGADGEVANNFGQVRFVVRDGAQFYISEATGNPQDTAFTLDPASTRWAPYSPSAPYALRFDAASAAFSARTFSDITAVGVYHATEGSTAPNRRAGLNFERFRVTAAVEPALVFVRDALRPDDTAAGRYATFLPSVNKNVGADGC